MAQTGAAAVVEMARQHGTAGAEDGGDIQPRGRHEQAGDVFVAVGDHDQTVELVGHDHGLRGVGDQVPGHQGVLHSHVAHGDAVTDGDGREHDGCSSCRPDAGFDGLHDLVDVHMAGHDLVIGADHAHQRALDLLLRQAQGIQQAAVGGPLHPFCDMI